MVPRHSWLEEQKADHAWGSLLRCTALPWPSAQQSPQAEPPPPHGGAGRVVGDTGLLFSPGLLANLQDE